MKKCLTLPIIFVVTACTELQSFASSLSSTHMPSYEFYEKYAETDDAGLVLPLFKQNLTIFTNEDGQQQVFKFPSNLVNSTTFNSYDPTLSWNFTNIAYPNTDIAKNKVKSVSLSFSSVLNFTKSNFYKIFELNSNDVKVTQLKLSCSSYRSTAPFYQITTKSGKSLYVVEDSGSDSASSQTSISFFRKLPTCESLGYEKTNKQYGNNSFNE